MQLGDSETLIDDRDEDVAIRPETAVYCEIVASVPA
jgi:hypothetical protein